MDTTLNETLQKSGPPGPDRVRLHESLQRQHHRARREEPGASVAPWWKTPVLPAICPTRAVSCSAEHVQQTEMAIMADNFAAIAQTSDLV